MRFSKENVLVTGGSRGIGAQVCRVLAGFGLKVWINYHTSAERADSLKLEIEQAGGRAAVIGFDASDEAAFVGACKTIVEADGGLGYLVNNAGITKDKLALRMSTDDFESIVHANLSSAFIGSREALKIMSKQRFGAVVNVSSIVGEQGNMGQANYAASKGGMIALTKTFALEGAPRNVRFNAVAPGFIDTDMTQALGADVRAQYEGAIPLKRLGTSDDVAHAIAFLLSDFAQYITGEVLRVKGGLYM